ncbi:organic cation transporter protein-like isoform X1 [Mytilus californianus]|uniref:organic cation transporter protein-like isoform X1 n=2 Tax=Mytilus californianus TaxID=6549 RepID=UPI0022481E8A|nr:organic cation transporter protein-like isoform X1 [Mytilus californianus]
MKMSSELNEYLESVLTDLGGLGRYQFILTLVVLGSKATVAWSVLMMAFGGVMPDWSCEWHTESGETFMPNATFDKKCSLENTTEKLDCVSRQFDASMNTIVSEWDLVCDKYWIVSSITTIQMFGLLIGAFVSGQVGDLYGRKKTYYVSIIILLVFNVVGAFSTSWHMFAVVRFLVGVGCGWYLTIDITYLAELIPIKYRSVILSLPVWPIGAMSNGLICYFLHDWKYIQIANAIFCLPWFLGIGLITESYRWLISHGRIDEAYEVMIKIARINGRSPPNKQKLIDIVNLNEHVAKERKYTLLDILRNKHLLKVTALLSFTWVSCGYGFYAISFGVAQLSGNLYLNMALLGLMESTSFVVCYFANCIGRKKASFVFFLLSGITGITIGIVQFLDLSHEGALINGLALTCKLCVACGWMALIIFTSELYPTVVRNIGFGFNNTMSRVGSMIAPQLIFASYRLPGIMFLLLGGFFTMSAFCLLLLKETNNLALKNTINDFSLPVKQNESLKTVDESETLFSEKCG